MMTVSHTLSAPPSAAAGARPPAASAAGRNGGGGYSEWRDCDGRVRPHYAGVAEAMGRIGAGELARRWRDANRQADFDAFTFYLDPREYRPAPTDWLPRVIPSGHWRRIADGVAQRLKAINRFLLALYDGEQTTVPPDVVYSSRYFYPEALGFRPPKDVFVHIYGADLVHMGGGRYVVLEDNLRIPSGIAYQLKTAEMAARLFPEFADGLEIAPYDIRDAYLDMFRSICDSDSPACVLLTDGKFGSAFFEHRCLSDTLGIPLVEGSDLYVGHDGRVYARTLGADYPVDLIYRRVEDLEMFVPGLRESYLAGKVALVNGIGSGAADDKLAFRWVPDMIKAHLGEEPILEQPETHNPQDPAERLHVLENLDKLVIKTRQGYGGLGVFVMPDLDAERRAQVARDILERPDLFAAQETLDFSDHMVFNASTGAMERRSVDLRVFAVQNGRGEVTVFPGGLTRVALPGGRITNNSSGGLCKPTWVTAG